MNSTDSNTNPLEAALGRLLNATKPATYEERLQAYNAKLAERQANEKKTRRAIAEATDALEAIYNIEAVTGYDGCKELKKARKQLAVFREDCEAWLMSPIPKPPQSPAPAEENGS
jgi:hypothetical protein